MTELSPAAQAVLDAFNASRRSNAMADIPYEPVVRDRKAERARVAQIPGYREARQEAAVEFRLQIAAALRAAADQVVPEDYSSYTGHSEYDLAMEARNDSDREAILAIADELDGPMTQLLLATFVDQDTPESIIAIAENLGCQRIDGSEEPGSTGATFQSFVIGVLLDQIADGDFQIVPTRPFKPD